MDAIQGQLFTLYDSSGGNLSLNFLNTLAGRSRPHPAEQLRSYAEFLDWCQEAGLVEPGERRELATWARREPRLALFALEQVRAVREAIYGILSALMAGEAPSEEDKAHFSSFLREALQARTIQVEGPHPRWAWRSPTEQPVAPLYPVLYAAAELFASDDLARVRTCANLSCGRVFLDHSRNQSRKWCISTDCGNRERVRAYYRRRGVNSDV